MELLVAMAAGLVVSMAAFLLSKNATRFFQNEARASASHLAATLALNRLTSDLQRAAHLSSPNVQRDPFVCGTVASWPEGMRRLAGIAIYRNGSTNEHPSELDQSIANELWPDSIVIGGSFNTNEQFYFNSMTCGAGGCVIHVDPFSTAVQRTVLRAQAGGETIGNIFRPGRYLRIKPLGGRGEHLYGIIQGTSVVGNPINRIDITLTPTPALPFRDAGSPCGISSGFNGGGGFVNPVSRVLYDIRSLKDTRYAPLVAPVNVQATGDNGRTELVRVELDENDDEIDTTLELIAEYAVDLKFGITEGQPESKPAPHEAETHMMIRRYPITAPIENDHVYNIGGENLQSGTRPQHVRAVQVRLSTRTRAPDRDVGLGVGPDGRRLRFLIPGIIDGVDKLDVQVPNGAPPVFARMRTLYADVALPNQASILW